MARTKPSSKMLAIPVAALWTLDCECDSDVQPDIVVLVDDEYPLVDRATLGSVARSTEESTEDCIERLALPFIKERWELDNVLEFSVQPGSSHQDSNRTNFIAIIRYN